MMVEYRARVMRKCEDLDVEMSTAEALLGCINWGGGGAVW